MFLAIRETRARPPVRATFSKPPARRASQESAPGADGRMDHLMGFATPLEVWYAVADRKLERDWVDLLEREPRFSWPIPRFGASDYHRSRTSHLFFSKRRPAFRWFEQRVREGFEPDIIACCEAVRAA